MEGVNKIKEFLAVCYGDGSGSGYGHGSGSGYGDGDGYGSGYGSSYGDGYGYGSGDGHGSSYGDGYGSSYGDGYGYGSGYGSGDGSGYGYGSGDGHGSGYGYGSGYGHGSSSGYGYGSSSGYGYGSGDGIKSINGELVFRVDGVQTVIDRVRGNIAKGRILNSNLTTTPCFVVKQNNLFAHGKNLREAMAALTDKLFDDMSEEERIEEFIKAHPTDTAYPNTDFYDWHHKLTGSCDMGRKTFAQDHGIDLEGEMTVSEFIDLTKNAYGGSTIRKLAEKYRLQRMDDERQV